MIILMQKISIALVKFYCRDLISGTVKDKK